MNTMLKKFLLLAFLPTISYGQDFATSLGSFKYTASNNTIYVKEFTLKDKSERFSYTRDLSPDINQSFSAKFGNFSFTEKDSKIFKSDFVGFKNKDFSLGYLHSNTSTQSDNEYSYANKSISLSIIDFQDKSYSKHFLGFKNKDIDFKSVSDKGLNVQSVAFGATTIAHDIQNTYIQSKYKDLSWKISSGTELNYSFSYKSFSYNDKQWFYGYKNKSFYTQFGSDYRIHNLNYNTKIGDSNLVFKYTDKFDVYDFYFNQTVFNVMNNNFNMIGKSKTTYKESTSLNISNNKYSLNADAINDLYNISLKLNKTSSVGYLSDQKGKYFTVGDNSKAGVVNIGYNLELCRIDTIHLGLSYKF